MSMQYKSFSDMYRDVEQQIKNQRERDGGKLMLQERIEQRRQVTTLVFATAAKILSAGLCVAAVEHFYPGAPTYVALLVGFIAMAVALENAKDQLTITLAGIKSGEFVREQMLEAKVKRQELLKGLEARATGNLHVDEMGPEDSMLLLAHELKKATKQGRLRDAAAIRQQMDAVNRGMHGDATAAYLKKQDTTTEEQDTPKH